MMPTSAARRSKGRRRGWFHLLHGRISRSFSSTIDGQISCPSFCQRKSASQRCSRQRANRRTKVVGRMPGWQFPRELGIYGRKGGRECRDGRGATRIFPGYSRSGGTSNQTSEAGQHHIARLASSVVNGPVRNEIGMNAGIGAMGPYNHANTMIGRAYSLLSQNGQGGSGARRNVYGRAWQSAGLQPVLSRERGTQPLAAAPRAEGVSSRLTAPSAFSSAIAGSRRDSDRRDT